MNLQIVISIIIFYNLFGSYLCMVNRQHPKVLANLTKRLLQAIAKPGRLTAMTPCWTTDVSFKFYESFTMPVGNNELNYELSISNISFNNVLHSNQIHSEFIMIDRNCKYSMDVLKFIGKSFDDYAWIIWNFQSDQTLGNDIIEEIYDIFSGIAYISPRSEIFYSKIRHDATDSEQTYVFQIYRIDSKKPLMIESFGTFGIKNFTDLRSSSITSRRRMNLSGYNFKASFVITNNDTLNHLDDYRDTQTDPLTKVNYILTEFLMHYLNSTVNFTTVSSWGYRDEKTGDWSGMVGQLIRNEVEIGGTPLFLTVDRVPIIQYIASPTPTGSRFIFRSPKLSYTDNVYILPFDESVWYCLILLIFVAAVFLTISVLIEWNYFLPEYGILNDESSLLHPKIGDVFLLVFGATCQQGSSVTPRSASARLIMIITSTILMFLYTSYSANIVALLQSPSTRIKTLKDLYESRLEIGVDDTVFNRYYFAHAEEPIRKKFYLNKVGQDNFMNLEEGVRRVRQGLFAFHMELSIGYKLMGETFFEDEKCGIVEIPYLQVTDPWYAIQKNSTFREMFKIGMMRMREHGLEGRENTRMYSKKPQCIGHTGNFITASLIDAKPALLILLWGFTITNGIFFFEWIVHNHLKKMKKNNIP